MWPKIDESYQIDIKRLWWKVVIVVNSCLLDLSQKINLHDKKFFIDKLSKYGFEIKNTNNFASYKFISPKYIDLCYIDFYFVQLVNNEQIKIIEIIDLCVNEKYRSKEIGSQFIDLLNKIALKNGVDYIVGELEGDNEGEPLDRRKKFYIKNGYIIKATEKSKISGFIVKKRLTKI